MGWDANREAAAAELDGVDPPVVHPPIDRREVHAESSRNLLRGQQRLARFPYAPASYA
jgi:hypothetical protein